MDAALKMPPPGFDDLSPVDQLDYLVALWGRMLAAKEALPVPDWHRQEVAARLAEYREGKAGAGRDWAEARKDLKARLARIR